MSFVKRHKGKISLAAVASIMATMSPYFEGTVLKYYKDAGSVGTICTGDTKHAKPGMVATPAECKRWFEEQAITEIDYVDSTLANADVTEEQLAAFGDFTYNLGHGAWQSSGIINLMEQGEVKAACDRMLVYNKGPVTDPVTGKQKIDPKTHKRVLVVYKGLVKRREAEWRLCMGKDWRQ